MGFWKDPRRKDWVYKFQYQGKEHGGRGYKTKAEARTAREEHRKKLKSESIHQTSGMDFRELAYSYLDDAKRRFAEKTYKGKAYTYRLFLQHHGDMPIQSITSQHIDSFLKTRPSNNNFNVHRKELYALFTYAKKKLKIINYNPCQDVEPMPHTPGRKAIPSETQILELIIAADPVTERPLLLTVLQLLGRIDEALRLTWQDVNFDKRVVTLWTRKRKGGAYEADPMPMNNDLHDVLWHLWKNRVNEKWVFYNEKTGSRYNKRPKMMKSLCMRAFDPGCKRVADYTGPVFGFHSLRHFMASYLNDKKKSKMIDPIRL